MLNEDIQLVAQRCTLQNSLGNSVTENFLVKLHARNLTNIGTPS